MGSSQEPVVRIQKPADLRDQSRQGALGRALLIGLGITFAASLGHHLCLHAQRPETPKKHNPAAWGSDHVGEEVPEYTTGGECLFCHRKEIGPHWQTNRHQLAIRPAEADSDQITALSAAVKEGEKAGFVLGRDRMRRYLRKGEGYGKLELHSHRWNPQTRMLVKGTAASWDGSAFGKNCAGCHASGVDSELQAFSSLSIDCYSCHGDIDLDHSNDSSKMLLASKRKDPARVTVSVCAQCHLRTGKSRSTGRPYPNNFVPGDNLFRDFQVSFAPEVLAELNPIDRHIHENVREVAVRGMEGITCLTCHEVHKSSTSKHERLNDSSASCATCHESKDGKWTTLEYEVHSTVCGY